MQSQEQSKSGQRQSRGKRLLSAPMLAVTASAFAVFLVLPGWVYRPRMSSPPPAREPAEVKCLRDALEREIDPAKPLRLQVDVDYTEGTNGSWYPKGESPILADLVREGKLPPVAERVGPEPCVYRGPDGPGKYGGTWVGIGFSPGYRLSASTLVRWSPQGYPVVPHLARSRTPDVCPRVALCIPGVRTASSGAAKRLHPCGQGTMDGVSPATFTTN